MSAYTNLDYVQAILSALDGEEINSVSDNVESTQVLNCIKTVYNDLQARLDLPEHYTLFELTASGDPSYPVKMTRPDAVTQIIWVQYNKILSGNTNPLFQDVCFQPLDVFLRRQDQLKLSDTNVDSFDITIGTEADSITFLYRNDIAPTYYTTYDDHTLIFDSYDSDVDGTLQKTKTRCYGKKDQTFTSTDTFVPFLDRDASTLLLNEAKVLAFTEMKQVGHDVARQWANRGWAKIQKNQRGVDNERSELDRLPNYSRR